MTNRKNYNSILFLTVYLGLVLVGGNAQVLAHAATNSLFDLRNEIEFKDDLDNQPDDCEKVQKLAEEKLQVVKADNKSVLEFAEILKNVIRIGQEISSRDFSFDYESRLNTESKYDRYTSFNFQKPKLFPKNGRSKINSEVEKLANTFHKKSPSEKSNFTLSFSTSEKLLTTKATFLQNDDSTSHRLYIAYNASLDFQRCKEESYSTNFILRNTEISWENNQIFIVTRLPRGSIDSLLKQSVFYGS